jgi:hypothetical protein
LPLAFHKKHGILRAMSTVAEIETAIEHLSSADRETLEARWLARRFGLEALGDNERAELLASLEAADREIDAGPTHSATELRQAVREWAAAGNILHAQPAGFTAHRRIHRSR